MRKRVTCGITVAALASGFFIGQASMAAPTHRAEPAVPVMHFIYLVPADRPLHPQYQAAIANASVIVQHWFYQQLGGKTFTFATPSVQTFKTSHRAAWYSNHKPTGPPTVWDQAAAAPGYPPQTFWYQDNVEADGAALAHAHRNDPRQAWILYCDAPYGDGQPNTAGGGIGVLPNRDLAGMIGESESAKLDEQSPCCWVGGLALYIDFTLGGREQFHYQIFPHGPLSAADRATLIASPFMRSVKLRGAALDCSKQPLGKFYPRSGVRGVRRVARASRRG